MVLLGDQAPGRDFERVHSTKAGCEKPTTVKRGRVQLSGLMAPFLLSGTPPEEDASEGLNSNHPPLLQASDYLPRNWFSLITKIRGRWEREAWDSAWGLALVRRWMSHRDMGQVCP